MQSPVWGSEGRPRTPKLEGSNDCGLKADHDGEAVSVGEREGWNLAWSTERVGVRNSGCS